MTATRIACVGAVVALVQSALGAQTVDNQITFAKHVAPLMQQKCQVCHRPGSIAPTSLLTYDDVRRQVGRIKRRVEAREIMWIGPDGRRRQIAAQ